MTAQGVVTETRERISPQPLMQMAHQIHAQTHGHMVISGRGRNVIQVTLTVE